MNLIRILQRVKAKQLRHDLATCAKLSATAEISHRFSWRFPEGRNDALIAGANTMLSGRIVVQGAGVVKIGCHCSFREGTFIGSICEVAIGDNVYGAEGVFITDNNNHPVSAAARHEMTLSPPNSRLWKWDRPDVDAASVTIDDCVWLGRNCMILKGVRIGRGSIVAAGAVVTRSMPEFSIIAGNPARVVKTLPNDLDLRPAP